MIKALKRETTIAKRFPAALSLPSSALSRSLDGYFKSVSQPAHSHSCHPERSEGPMHFAGSVKGMGPSLRSEFVTFFNSG